MLPLLEVEHQFPSHPVYSLVTIPTKLFWLHWKLKDFNSIWVATNIPEIKINFWFTNCGGYRCSSLFPAVIKSQYFLRLIPSIVTLVVYTFRNKQSSEVGTKKFSCGWGHAAPSSVAFLIPCHGSIGTGGYRNKKKKSSNAPHSRNFGKYIPFSIQLLELNLILLTHKLPVQFTHFYILLVQFYTSYSFLLQTYFFSF
jgi:hypothetical protein